ncbi:hypothetical protein OAX11_05105 [Flavobacteriaceae bacterium]|nr:hypothetical protein [Flavobacteriaceae bacterium]
MKQILYILSLSLSLTGCFIGAGTHGSIKSYSFDYSTNELVTIVDQFLSKNPDYYDEVNEDNGWVYIKIPPENDRFGFRIGGSSEINLVAAGKENEKTKWEADLSYFEKKSLIENFELNFIQKLKSINPKTETIIKEPFILTINDNPNLDPWAHNVFKYDTIISYPLPKEFDSLSIDYFENLVLAFAENTKQETSINQHYNLFTVDKDYSGYIEDSIYITTFYRVIGQSSYDDNTLFNQKLWSQFTATVKEKERLAQYNELRQAKTKQKYKETEVYSEYSKEYWMVDKNELIKTVGNTVYSK